jgi:hypothetical protein
MKKIITILLLLLSLAGFSQTKDTTVYYQPCMNRYHEVLGTTFLATGFACIGASSYTLFRYEIGTTLMFCYVGAMFTYTGGLIFLEKRPIGRGDVTWSLKPTGIVLNF